MGSHGDGEREIGLGLWSMDPRKVVFPKPGKPHTGLVDAILRFLVRQGGVIAIPVNNNYIPQQQNVAQFTRNTLPLS